MALSKTVLQKQLFEGMQKIYLKQSEKATSGSESEDPKDVIRQISYDIADVIADAVDSYVKSGDIMISNTNIMVSSPSGACSVTPLNPAKIK